MVGDTKKLRKFWILKLLIIIDFDYLLYIFECFTLPRSKQLRKTFVKCQNTNTASIWPCHHCAVSLSRVVGLCLSHNGAQTIAKVGTTSLRIQQRPKLVMKQFPVDLTLVAFRLFGHSCRKFSHFYCQKEWPQGHWLTRPVG